MGSNSIERVKQPGLREFRDPSDVPFYCNPVYLFFVEWAMMLAVFQLRISYTSYPDIVIPLVLFALSATAFLGGYTTLRLAYSAVGKAATSAQSYRIHIPRLRTVQVLGVLFVVALMLMDLVRYGLPPIFGFFGFQTLDYQEYGALNQPVFSAILILFASAPLETSPWRRWFLYIFCPVCFLILSSRGYLLIMLFQALASFSLRTSLSKTKIYAVAGTTLGIAVLLSDLIGNGRNSLGVEALLGYLQIKHAYSDWPSANLWVLSYIATPFSNLCWIVHSYRYKGPSLNFLASALPGFFGQKDVLQIGDLGTEKIVDGVHTYAAKYFVDFWYFGILGINYVWGLIAAYMSTGNRLTRNFLVSSVLLGCMGFMFFSDFLTILIILLELGALALMQRYVVLSVPTISG